MKTRFGKFRLGYLWALLEPVAHMLVMLAIFKLSDAAHNAGYFLSSLSHQWNHSFSAV